MPLQTLPQQPLNLLSLDGGTPEGVVTQITMIQEILSRRAYDEGKDVDSGEIFPCDYFDIIGGTGLGGVLALLFGNCHMSCRDARENFEGVCNEAFTESEDPSQGYLQWVKDAIVGDNKSGVSREMLDLEKLRVTMKKVFDGTKPDPKKDGNECVAVVFVRPTFNLANTIAVPFRNGQPLQIGYDATVHEAACATVATPNIFGPVETAAGDSFISAGLGATNPTRELIKVAKRIYKGDRRVGCIVNLGAGTRRAPSSRGENAKEKGGDSDSATENVVRNIEEHMALEAMRTSERLKRELSRANYFYLSVDSGLHDAKMIGWDLSVAEVHANSYTDKEDSNKLIDDCVGALSGESPGASVAELVQATALGVNAKPLFKIPRHFVPPIREYNDMVEALIKRKEPILVVSGRLGTGKSLLSSYYGHKERRRYKHIFLIDSGTEGDIRGDLQTAIRSIGIQHREASWKDALTFFMRAEPKDSWLLIFDGVGANIDLPQFIPHNQKGVGTVIINGHNKMLAVYAPNAHISMEPRSEGDALEILKLTAQYEDLKDDTYTQAVRLCKVVGCIPVVLVQAGTYCKRVSSVKDSKEHSNFDDYRRMYEKGKQEWEQLGEKAPAGMDSYNQYFMATLQGRIT